MRLFVRDPSKLEDAKSAFRKYCRKILPDWEKSREIEEKQLNDNMELKY